MDTTKIQIGQDKVPQIKTKFTKNLFNIFPEILPELEFKQMVFKKDCKRTPCRKVEVFLERMGVIN